MPATRTPIHQEPSLITVCPTASPSGHAMAKTNELANIQINQKISLRREASNVISNAFYIKPMITFERPNNEYIKYLQHILAFRGALRQGSRSCFPINGGGRLWKWVGRSPSNSSTRVYFSLKLWHTNRDGQQMRMG